MTGSITRLCLCGVIVWATAGAAEARRSRPAMPDGPRVETYAPGFDRIVAGSPRCAASMSLATLMAAASLWRTLPR